MAIRLLALDVDGVLTDGTLYYTSGGEEVKAFHVQDGLGLKLLGELGVEVAVVSGRQSGPLSKRLDDLGIQHRRLGCRDKVIALEDICADLRLTLRDCAFMGDDLIDIAVMKAVSLALAPASAVPEVKAVSHWIGKKEGGRGAVREACEYLAGLRGLSLADIASGVKEKLVQ